MKFNIDGKTIEVEDEVLSKAIEDKSESLDIKADGLVLRTTEEEDTFKENIKKEGIGIGAEVGRKEVLKGLDIVSDGAHKSDASAIEAIKGFSTANVTKALADAKIEPNAQIEAKDADILKLQGNIKELGEKNDTLESNFTSFKNDHLKSSTLAGLIPENIALPRADVLTLMNAKIKTDVNDQGVVFGVGADGQPMKNQTDMSVMALKDVVSGFFNDNSHLLKQSEGGAGGGDSGGEGGKQTLEEFTKEMSDAGNPINGEEFRKQMEARTKAGTLII